MKKRLKQRALRPGNYQAYDLLDIGYWVDSVIRVSLVSRAIGRVVFIEGKYKSVASDHAAIPVEPKSMAVPRHE
jgi:hypothetical protein